MGLDSERFLVTGGAGFIGSHIVHELVKQGARVRVLDNLSTGKRDNLSLVQSDVELIEGDIRSYHIVNEAVRDIDVVLHQAALPSVPRSIYDPITSNEVNVGGTLNILEAAVQAGVRKFVYASSSSVYGDDPQLPKQESMVPNPLSPYAVSKLAGEKYCRVFSKIYGLPTVALRYFNVFGPSQDPDSQYSAVIPRFITAVLNGRSPTIFGDGEQSRDFTFVDNAVHANLLAAASDSGDGAAMNCACGERFTLNHVVKTICAVSGTNVDPVYSEPRAGDIRHSHADITLAGRLIGYAPRTSFEEGLSRTVEYFQRTGEAISV